MFFSRTAAPNGYYLERSIPRTRKLKSVQMKYIDLYRKKIKNLLPMNH